MVAVRDDHALPQLDPHPENSGVMVGAPFQLSPHEEGIRQAPTGFQLCPHRLFARR